MMDTSNRIRKGADGLFRIRGVRNVTMDDIARELGMSKKTLYQYYKNKAEIVNAVLQLHFEEETALCKSITEEAETPLQEMLMVLEAFAKTMKEIPSSMVYEVQKYYPKAWELFHDFKNGFVLDMLEQNLRKGIATGLYRKDIDPVMLARLRVEQIELVFNPEVFPPNEYDLNLLQLEQFKLFLHGLVTLKGKKLIYQYLNQPEDE